MMMESSHLQNRQTDNLNAQEQKKERKKNDRYVFQGYELL